MCQKYEKKFNFNVQKAVQMNQEKIEEEVAEKESSLIPTLSCFGSDFRLVEETKIQKKNVYQNLQPKKIKKQVYSILFCRQKIINNPFILDFNLHNLHMTNQSGPIEGNR